MIETQAVSQDKAPQVLIGIPVFYYYKGKNQMKE